MVEAPFRTNGTGIAACMCEAAWSPFEEAVRKVYWDMAIYDKEAMELLIKRVGVDNVLFATEMFGATNAIDPLTGRNFEDTVPILESIDWLSDQDRQKITEGNALKVFSRLNTGS